MTAWNIEIKRTPENSNDLLNFLINLLKANVYPTSQIVFGDITTDEYVLNLAKHYKGKSKAFITDDLFDRRMPKFCADFFIILGDFVR